jgi:hypothetical protein
MIEKKWKERNYTQKEDFTCDFKLSHVLINPSRGYVVRLVNTENLSACVTVNCKVRRSATAL